MSDYFSDVRQGLGDAVERRAHLRWHARLRERLNLRGRGSRPLVVVFAMLVIATPAVGAVTSWFSFGKPDATPPLASNGIFGVVKPGASELLPLRASDPQGGPPWGLRLVRTNRGNTCLQLGRVESGQLGSLGIDDSWNDDHRFHAISPNAAYIDECGSTDAAGHGYVNLGVYGESASANPTYDTARGPQSRGCKLHHVGGPPSWPYCPAGSSRIIFYGLLGPDATSITYRKPDGGLATERTVAGAYLIVFERDSASCRAYSQSAFAGTNCANIHFSGVAPDQLGSVTRITYRDGHSCSVDRGRQLTARRFTAAMRPCPAVGWVPFKRRVTSAEVTAPVHLRTFAAGTYSCPQNTLHLPDGCNSGVMRKGVVYPTRVVPVEWSFRARLSVTTDRSWYAWDLRYPRGCGAGGESGATDFRIRPGRVLRYSAFVNPQCRGTYQLLVGFMPDAPPGVVTAGGGSALIGRDGSLVVGRASFTIR